jgi:hypothetical protein
MRAPMASDIDSADAEMARSTSCGIFAGEATDAMPTNRMPCRPIGKPAWRDSGGKATSKNKRTGSEFRHPRESGDPGGLGPRLRGNDVECCLNARRFNYFRAPPNDEFWRAAARGRDNSATSAISC